MDKAEPGTPVEILGWRELPLAGDLILEVESEVSIFVRFRRYNCLPSNTDVLNFTEKSQLCPKIPPT